MSEHIDAISATSSQSTYLFNKLLADELHDTVCQSLAGTSFLVKVLIRQSEAGLPVATDDLKKTAKYLERAMNDVRAIATRPESLASGGLATALDQFSKSISEEIPCRVLNQTETLCDPNLAIPLYGMIRWTIRRVISSSAAVSIELMEMAGEFTVTLHAGFTGLTDQEKIFLEQSASAAGITVTLEAASDKLRFSVPALRTI